MSLESTIRSVMTESKEEIQEDEYQRLDVMQSKLRKMIDAYRQDKLPKNKVREFEMLQKEVKKLMAKLYYTKEEVECDCDCGESPCKECGVDHHNMKEEADMDEGRMKELHMMIDKGMSAEQIAKKMKLDVKTIKALMPEEVEADDALDNLIEEALVEEVEEVEEHTHYKMDNFGNSVSLLDAVNAVLSGKVKRENIPEEILDDDVADFIGAASKAAQAGKKTFKFGDKEYPVTIKKDTAKKVASKMEEKDSEDKKMKDKKDEKMGKKEPVEIDPAIKEDAEKMTDAQMKKREEIVKELKKKEDEFKERYGDKYQDVMYATATKMAMKSVDEIFGLGKKKKPSGSKPAPKKRPAQKKKSGVSVSQAATGTNLGF